VDQVVDLSALGEGTAAVWTRAQALQLLSRQQVATRLADGTWQVVWPGTYADGGFVLDPVQRAFGAVLGTGGPPPAPADLDAPTRPLAIACARTAARVWGLPLIDDDDPATGGRDGVHHDVAVRQHLGDLEHWGQHLHRHELQLTRAEVTRTGHGLWLTTVPRTLLDLTGCVSHEALVCAIDHGLHAGLVDLGALQAVADARGGLPWAARFRRAVQAADGRAESPAETLARLLLAPHLPDLRPQVRLRDRSGRVLARFDLADETLRLAVECDGRRGHAGELMVAKDRRRDGITADHGWVTERATWYQLRRHSDEVLQRTLTAARRRPAA
jgi:very-short-patch-repair endonuclease